MSTNDRGGAADADKIRALNDALRHDHIGGKIVMTMGVASLGDELVKRLVDAVSTFDNFNGDNDPHNEHDFGAIEMGGEQFFWKIDYYDNTLEAGSEDPADPSKTIRVLTIMRSEEY